MRCMHVVLVLAALLVLALAGCGGGAGGEDPVIPFDPTGSKVVPPHNVVPLFTLFYDNPSEIDMGIGMTADPMRFSPLVKQGEAIDESGARALPDETGEWPLAIAAGAGDIAVLNYTGLYRCHWNGEDAGWGEFERVAYQPSDKRMTWYTLSFAPSGAKLVTSHDGIVVAKSFK